MKVTTFLFITLIVFCSCSKLEKEPGFEYSLWYNQPAVEWEDALPVGNGRLGAMIFGNPETERIQFNEESLWAGSKVDNNNPESLEHLGEIRQLIFDGDFKKAGKMAADHMVGTPPKVRSYQTFGDLMLDYHWKSKAKHYKRELNLHSGIATTTYEIEDNLVKQEVFASAPDNVIVVRISATKPFNVDIALKRERDVEIKSEANGTIKMIGQIIDTLNPKAGPAGAHMKFAAMAKVKNEGGKLENINEGIACNEVKTVTIYLSATTNYDFDNLDLAEGVNPSLTSEKILNNIGDKSFADLKQEHIKDHRGMFDRVSFTLGQDSLATLPTDERLNRVKDGAMDNGLMATYFQYGRYLLMGSSRKPGKLPANLQGVWNKHYNAPWNADFHTNINLQMNYWPAEVCNLPETSLLLANFMEKLTVPGGVTTQKMYGTKGWTLHHLTDAFGRTGVADGVWGVSPLAGPWMTFPLYRHYEFTKDKEYLRNIYPVLKGSAEFIVDFLVESPEGYLVTNPSHSPENAFFIPGSDKKERSVLTYGSTIDIQIINELFDIITESSEILDIDHQFSEKIEAIRKKLPEVQIGENGTIQEWIKDFEEVNVGHRHMSHLLGLYPLAQITADTPELFEAAQKTIQRRLGNGGAHTGWSRAWIINFYARLQNGEKAHENIQALLAKSTLTNLFDSHPPFQIDGNFGGTSGMAEMLLQSHNETIRLLPALPKAWSEGSITGLKARGDIECDITWNDGKLTKAVFYSEEGGSEKVVYGSENFTIDLKPGEAYVFEVNKQ
ncbi:glycoside hydrolase N-terminal domain-containing protein [Formosa undariae]|uniref:Glycoside hydrolase N-terminal domain-containing protein n=1 Tax=Formosa undariae TaxID=1325436 RepID=A0ABV5F446_9FLAO